MTGHVYREAFFDHVDVTATRSAAALLARLALGFTPGSVLDVGCGRGAWLEAWKARGIPTVVGVDGDHLDRSRLRIGGSEFRIDDLSRPFDLGRRFDLVQCLEVAEHVPAAAARDLVASLVRHGDVVLFSAAPPGQGGEHHVNEQPREYWMAQFAAHGFAAFDCVRPAVQGVREIRAVVPLQHAALRERRGASRLGRAARRAPVSAPAPARSITRRWRGARGARSCGCCRAPSSRAGPGAASAEDLMGFALATPPSAPGAPSAATAHGLRAVAPRGRCGSSA